MESNSNIFDTRNLMDSLLPETLCLNSPSASFNKSDKKIAKISRLPPRLQKKKMNIINSSEFDTRNLMDSSPPEMLCLNSPPAPIKSDKKMPKRTRLGPRLQKQYTNSSALDDLDPGFKIIAIHNQKSGKVCRIKKSGCRHTHASLNLCRENNVINSSSRSSINSSGNGSSVQSTPSKLEIGIRPLMDIDIPVPLIPNLQSNPMVRDVKAKKPRAKKQAKKAKQYPPYWLKRVVDDSLQKGLLLQGTIRINQKNSTEAYVTSEHSRSDYLLKSIGDRNRALEGDIVAIKLKPEKEWQLKYMTASVVYILEKVHSRLAIGQLITKDGFTFLTPRDKRLPRIKIIPNNIPINVVNNNTLALGKIMSWPDMTHAEGILCNIMGQSGDLESEKRAIFTEHGVDITPHSPSLLKSVACTDKIGDYEFRNRTDFRQECIFTIDPLTARDLDDAVSCTKLPNGNFHVGVHISDVAFYVGENTDLDLAVRRKGTSVYMVDNVYHMLPPELCMRCSLLPGLDKRAFSVVWELTNTGEIVKEYFTRSVINSCAQLAYEHVQLMIENPDGKLPELPQIFGGHTAINLRYKINCLQHIASNLRRQRFENGALKIDQTKLIFRLNESGQPIDFMAYENKEAHRLIEEFMLLANISVAKKISKHYPNLAFLRRHEPPKETMLVDLTKKLEPYNIQLDISSSKAIQASILNVAAKLGIPHMTVINHLLAKPMKRARYFCASTETNFLHFALHIPIYTHFTSPIRRYADVMVHRLLAASLGYTPNPLWTVQEVAAIASHCNNQKYAAKLAGDASLDLYLAHYIEEHQPFIRSAVIFHVRERSFDVLVPSTGSVIRIRDEDYKKEMWKYEDGDDKPKVIITFKQTDEYEEEKVLIEMFQTITISLHRIPNTNSLSGKMLRPVSSQLITSTGA